MTGLTDEAALVASGNLVVSSVVNHAPTDLSLSNANVNENAVGAVIGTLTATDPDAGGIYGFTVDDTRFEVVAGQLRLKAGQSLDYETASSVTVNVTVTDQGGLYYTEAFALAVNDVSDAPVNHAPTDLSLSNASVNENAAGAVIGTLTVTDPDAGSSHGLTVDDARFEVVSGQLKLKAGQALDYETAHTVTVNITATDQGGLQYTEAFTVNVNDVLEGPPTALFSAGNDTVNMNTVSAGSFSGSLYDALAGVDIVTLPNATQAALMGYDASNTFYGGSGNDTITGGDLNDIIDGGTGVDTLYGGEGNDTLIAVGSGDTLSGGNGNDTLVQGTSPGYLQGDQGNDIYLLQDGSGTVDESAGGGIDTIVLNYLYDEGYTFQLSSYYELENLTLIGAIPVNGSGNALANILIGNSAHNVLDGKGGDDIIAGGGDNDTLIGGTGQDTFVFSSILNGIDTISDFSAGQSDKIDISDLLTDYDPLTMALADFVQISNSGSNSTVSVDRDGTGSAYGFAQIATINGVTGLTDEDALVASGQLIVT
ncbi:MAG: cadherin domain-containing protein [Alphaproteobacteria bacterium]